MTSPSPRPPKSLSSAADRPSSSAQSSSSTPKSQSQAWGAAQPGRRGLAPISTAFNAASSSASPAPRNPWSPPTTTTAHSAASNKQGLPSASISSTNSPFSPPSSAPPSSSAAQHQHQNSSSTTASIGSNSRSRNIASSTNPGLASAAAASQTIGGTVSSGGGSSKNFRASPSLVGSNFGSPTLAANAGGSGASKSGPLAQIVVAQLFLLLSTIKEDKDSPKWEQEADKIRKLVESNGMEVFSKYFRRLLQQNASQIWGASRNADSSGSYPILMSEMQKVAQDPSHAAKIVESIETGGEGEVFKDFDLFTFMEHFKLSPQAKIALATAFKKASKPDLRNKADAIISNNLQSFLNSVATTSPSQSEAPEEEAVFAFILNRLAQDLPRNWNNELHQTLIRSFERRYHNSNALVPLEISSALILFDLVTTSNPLVKLVQKHGPKASESLDGCKSMLDSADARDVNYQQVSSALLFMVIARDELQYDAATFVSALREHHSGQRLDWQDVVRAFDRERLRITRLQFKRLFDSLMPIAHQVETFDIQLLWGGAWRNEETQLTFAAAFLSFSEAEIDASQIPRLHKAYTMEDFADASEEIKTYAETATKHPLVSLEATSALFRLVFQTSDTYTHAQNFGVIDSIINPKMDLFVGSVSAVPKPWEALQDQAIKQLVGTLFFSGIHGHGFALHLLWKRDMAWLIQRLLHLYQQNPMHLVPILDLAQERDWLNDLIASNSELSLDLAALAHGRHLFDLESWLQQVTQEMQRDRVVAALCTFLNQKIDSEVAYQREKTPFRTVPLTVRTVHALLTFLGNEGLPEAERTQLQRGSITAYPRLINYGEGFDEIIDANGQDGNALSADADTQMQEYYRQMYCSDVQVKNMIELLQQYKMSQDPENQELFAAMIFSLFDEYNCYAEYPLSALAMTAVLFGSVINFNLLSKVALQVAISIVLESIRDHKVDDSMYKFGLQALLHFQERLEEWTRLSEILLEIPGLQGTPIYPTLEKIAREREEAPNGDQNGNEKAASAADDFLAQDPAFAEFACLTVDPPSRAEFYQTPDEKIQESVLFVLNNVSERNLKDKSRDLKSNLREENLQWFANYVVESRIRSQPNYHQLYMDILQEFNSRDLWAEVLRETYVCSIRMLNAESTMNSSNERGHLKNLGSWLGSITLARNQAIRHRNIPFKDLLIEAHDKQRLLVVIPFTCKVLAMAGDSPLFKPPCSWTVEILSVLMELYEFPELKLNLKFEIEVLCKALGVEQKEIQPSDVIRTKPQPEEDILPTALADSIDGFHDLSMLHLARPRGMAERFSPTTISPQLHELTSNLKHLYSLPALTPDMQSDIRLLLSRAVDHAVSEIIGPVVERSVTIAAISASQLITKDLALEPDIDRFREISHKSVRALAGSLAQVTCKEPLRASMQNHIQNSRGALSEHELPQNLIMMFINDNIDAVCNFVEKAAESASTNEIDAQIGEAIQARQRPDFVEPQISRWAYYIPDPYKPTTGGLNQDQLAIYEDFSRTGRTFPVQNNLSQESARQIPDVLQDQYANTFPPVGEGSLQHGSVHQSFPDHPSRNTQDLPPQVLMNGFVNGQRSENRAAEGVKALRRSAIEALEEDPNQPLADSASVREAWAWLLQDQYAIAGPAQKHEAALAASKEAINVLVQGQDRPEILDLMAQVLRKQCDFSDLIAQYIYTWCMDPHQERILNSTLTVALLKSGLLDVRRLDIVTASAIHEREPGILDFLQGLINTFWLNDSASPELPGAWRADLVLSMAALSQWISADPGLTKGQQIKRSLEESMTEPPQAADDLYAIKEAQLEYIFNEWTRLQINDASSVFLVSFAKQLHSQQILKSREDTVALFRACINASIASYEQIETRGHPTVDNPYIKIDAFARLLVMVTTHQGKLNGAVKVDKLAFLEDMLSLLVLIFSQHYSKGSEVFNQKVFFRLFSTLCSEIQTMPLSSVGESSDIVNGSMHVFGKTLAMLNPRIFPAFSFSWLSVISHRSFMPTLLGGSNEEGRAIFCELLCQQLWYVGELMKPLQVDFASKDYYRGTLKLLLVLHHDYPQFLAEYHLRLLNSIPFHCTQMRSLIISASPASPDFPDPFHDGLKVDRLDDSRRRPIIRGGLEKLNSNSKFLNALDSFLNGDGSPEEHINTLVQIVHDPMPPQTGPGFTPLAIDVPLLNSLVVYIVQQSELTSRSRNSTFLSDSPHARLFDALMNHLSAEGRYHLINAIVNQLRYPNSHTHYFSYVLFHLYRDGKADRLAHDIQQQIIRVLLERIVAHRPHPWGLMVVLLEFLKNETYHVWEAPFVRNVPDVQRMLSSLLQQMGQSGRAMS